MEKIEHYRIETLIGEGGMGAVYRAFDQRLERPVAVKVMHRQYARQATFRQRFLQEARAAARLDHPGVVTIHHFGQQDELLYLVMAFVPGDNLRRHVAAQAAAGEARLDEILRLAAQVADALGYAHRQGIVHRDIKPDNILVQPGTPPRALVTDFGLAKLLDGGLQTQTGTFMGTLPYMSPEQCAGRPLDGRSDLYALGVVLFQLLTGRLPFAINSPTEAITHHVSTPPPDPTTLQATLPRAVADIVLRTLAKQPDERYADGESVARALRAAADAAGPRLLHYQQANPQSTTVEQLADSLPTPVPAPGSRPTGEHLLLTTTDGRTRAIPLLEDSLRIGRDPENEILIDDEKVSRFHARLDRRGAGWQVVDLNSSNGTLLNRTPLLPGISEPWAPEQTLRIGGTFLRYVPAAGPANAGSSRLFTEVPERMATSVDGLIGLQLSSQRLETAPGKPVGLTVNLYNSGSVVERYTLRVVGLPAAWVAPAAPVLSLMPGASGSAELTITPPDDGSARAGEQPFTVIANAATPERDAIAAATLVVGEKTGLTVDLRPRTLSRPGPVQVALRNEGNAPTTIHFDQAPVDDLVEVETPAQPLTLAPGETGVATVTVRPKSRPLVGTPRSGSYRVALRTPDGKRHAIDGSVTVAPRLPTWMATGLLGLLLTLCTLGSAAAGFYFLRDTPTPTQVVGGGGGGEATATLLPGGEATPQATGESNATPQATEPAGGDPAATGEAGGGDPTPTPTPTATQTPAPTATANPSPTPAPPTPTPFPAGWSSLGAGVAGPVNVVVADGDLVYVGGDFPGGVRVWNNATLTWSDLGGGLSAEANDLAVHEGVLYAVGRFSRAINGDGSEVVSSVVAWDGERWIDLGGGLRNNDGLGLRAVAVDNEGNVYVGGNFGRNISRWVVREQRWEGLGLLDPDAAEGLDAGVRNFGNDNPGDFVSDIAIDGEWVYVTGRFSNASYDLNNVNTGAVNVARWSRKTGFWEKLGSGLVNNTNTSNEINAVAVYDGIVYVGGVFEDPYPDREELETSFIAAWDGDVWLAMPGLDFYVFDIVADAGGVYAAGNGDRRETYSYGNVARWDGSSWTPLAAPNTLDITALAVADGALYVGGEFTTLGGTGLNYIGRLGR